MEYFQWVSDISMKSHLTCLLRCSNYSDVIAAVDAYNSSTSTPPSSPPHSFDNYKSYALYRSKKFKEAIEVSEKALEGMGSSEFRYSEMASFHHRHIVAQSHYRLQVRIGRGRAVAKRHNTTKSNITYTLLPPRLSLISELHRVPILLRLPPLNLGVR
jgi:hypothetical protein